MPSVPGRTQFWGGGEECGLGGCWGSSAEAAFEHLVVVRLFDENISKIASYSLVLQGSGFLVWFCFLFKLSL